MENTLSPENTFETDIPARLDRLPWTRFHWLVVCALGIIWILDGLEVTLVGSLSGAIAESPTLHFSGGQIGASASAYLAGAVLGALFRAVTGAGIGGEYAAVNATIQELIPARKRGFVDLVINGSFWIGAALGALGALVALDPDIVPQEIGWRAAFVIGGTIGFAVLLLRRWISESPRWLMTHGQPEQAEAGMWAIERRVEQETGALPANPTQRLGLRRDVKNWFSPSVAALFQHYRARRVLATALMAAQAFCYNAVFFTYALILTKFYAIPSGRVGLFMLPFALGNFAGPLLLGKLFDTLGRKPMITATYALSGVLMIGTGWLFMTGALSAAAQTAAWTGIFFVASAAASSAHLTVGESFPLEMRAVAIAVFYALGMLLGGVAGPLLFGALIQTGARENIFWGYLLGGGLMIFAAAVEAALGVSAEGRSLEDVAPPLSSVRPSRATHSGVASLSASRP